MELHQQHSTCQLLTHDIQVLPESSWMSFRLTWKVAAAAVMSPMISWA